MPRHMTPDQRTAALALYTAGATVDKIAEHFNRDRTTICRLVGRRGVRRGRVSRVDNNVDSTYQNG